MKLYATLNALFKLTCVDTTKNFRVLDFNIVNTLLVCFIVENISTKSLHVC